MQSYRKRILSWVCYSGKAVSTNNRGYVLKGGVVWAQIYAMKFLFFKYVMITYRSSTSEKEAKKCLKTAFLGSQVYGVKKNIFKEQNDHIPLVLLPFW